MKKWHVTEEQAQRAMDILRELVKWGGGASDNSFHSRSIISDAETLLEGVVYQEEWEAGLSDFLEMGQGLGQDMVDLIRRVAEFREDGAGQGLAGLMAEARVMTERIDKMARGEVMDSYCIYCGKACYKTRPNGGPIIEFEDSELRVMRAIHVLCVKELLDSVSLTLDPEELKLELRRANDETIS